VLDRFPLCPYVNTETPLEKDGPKQKTCLFYGN
jgi:hypothetical protein